MGHAAGPLPVPPHPAPLGFLLALATLLLSRSAPPALRRAALLLSVSQPRQVRLWLVQQRRAERVGHALGRGFSLSLPPAPPRVCSPWQACTRLSRTTPADDAVSVALQSIVALTTCCCLCICGALQFIIAERVVVYAWTILRRVYRGGCAVYTATQIPPSLPSAVCVATYCGSGCAHCFTRAPTATCLVMLVSFITTSEPLSSAACPSRRRGCATSSSRSPGGARGQMPNCRLRARFRTRKI